MADLISAGQRNGRTRGRSSLGSRPFSSLTLLRVAVNDEEQKSEVGNQKSESDLQEEYCRQDDPDL